MDAHRADSLKSGIAVGFSLRALRSRTRSAGRFKILVPIDGTSASLHALDYIAKSREIERTEILLLNVRPGIRFGDIFRSPSVWDAAEAQRAIGEDLMRPAMLQLDARRIHYSAEVAFGPTAKTIIEHAQRRGCDAVFVATRGDAGILRRCVGSVACRVLRLADLPVAIVKQGNRAPIEARLPRLGAA
jgi:nucleotide-binding universal stress UspA family protein